MLTKESTPKEVRRAWINALQSGEYPKCEAYLHIKRENREMFCALGVLCDLALKAGVIQQELRGNTFYYDEGRLCDLPSEVVKWAGISDAAGSMRINGRETSIISLNDEQLLPFEKIADIISTCPEGLFTGCDSEVDENKEVVQEVVEI